MKNYLFMVMLLITISSVHAQQEITTSFNSTHSGRSANLTYSKYLNEYSELGGGLRLNINSYILPDDQHKVFYKRLYATKPIQFIGAQGFYHYYLFQNLEHIKPFLFYDLQVAYATTINKFEHYDLELNKFVDEVQHWGPYWWMEQCVGVGFKVDIDDRFFIIQKLGVGYTVMIAGEKPSNNSIRDRAGEFGLLFNAGVGCRF